MARVLPTIYCIVLGCLLTTGASAQWGNWRNGVHTKVRRDSVSSATPNPTMRIDFDSLAFRKAMMQRLLDSTANSISTSGADADTIGREGRVFIYQSRGGIAILGQRFFDNYGGWFAFNSGRIPAGAQLGTAPVTLIPYKIAITHMHDTGAWYRRDTVITYLGADSIVAGGRIYTQYYFQEAGSLINLYKSDPHAANASLMTADPGTTSNSGYAAFQIPFFQGTLNLFSKNARIDHFVYVDIYFRQKIPGRKYR